MTSIDDYAARFHEEPGYLDFAAAGPIGDTARAEAEAFHTILAGGRFGSFAPFFEQPGRVRSAVAALTGFHPEQISFQPNTSQGLMHALFGLTGNVALSPAEFPSLPFAAVRAQEALGVVAPQWLETDHGRVTPGNIRDQLDASTAAVAVSLVDFRTGHLVDLEGIRQVIGDRLLIVDAIQGFGVVEAPYEVADVVAAGGQKWVRAGWGTGFLALSDRALERLTPVWSGFTGTEADGMPLDEVLPPASDARAFAVSNPDPIAMARFAGALEEIAEVGVAAIRARIASLVGEVIDAADEFALPVVSPRAEAERAGIVVIEPDADQLTALAAALHNHGVSATVRGGTVRLSPHASTDAESVAMLRSALLSFATA
ncbi:aminotransferase class V-fold PLP-dependent enzyme [Homoserinibacter sp. GY 40078]|uniref:aminotransferase class V-fold PLP-dependent enzyme n=1 Tax=Homoserinibacter sp. GY 40078 TaxID=2603275 RepID=UPI0011CBA04B|nr:aminotransferase class V-fold PLP-dependent enzyme [Homoserinibacter sp. GY 40078]TXK19561.1 aminotransferase class V-fold PLP-dependent enzyme [Homoserinibacter sp. GY 40078]